MSEGKDRALSSVLLAIAGLAVTAILGYGQWSLGVSQREAEDLKEKDAVEVQVMALIAPHLSKVREVGDDAESSRRIVQAAGDYLNTKYRSDALSRMYAQIVSEAPSVKQETVMRAQETTEVPTKDAPWYAVLASLPADDLNAAQELADEKAKMARGAGISQRVQIYRTKISNNYAVVLGGKLGKSTALLLAASAREKKLAPDAFAQQDRQNWDLVSDAHR
jgi:hypothetical protein